MISISKNSKRWIKALFPISGGIALILILGAGNLDRSSPTATPVQYRIKSKENRPSEPPIDQQERKSSKGTCTDLGSAEPSRSPYGVLDTLVKGKGSALIGSSRHRDLVETFAQAMEENPDGWEEIVFLISTGDGLDFFTTGILLEAFGIQENSFRAHEILLALIRNPEFPMKMKRTAVRVLALARQVPEQTVQFLREEASQEPGLRDVALHVLAKIARRCPAHRNKIVRYLGDTLQTDLIKGDPIRVVETLSALGRSGTDSKRDLVRSLTSHPSPRLRSTALISLGRSNPEMEKIHILHALRADSNPQVRLAALEAIQEHPVDPKKETGRDGIPEEILHDLRWTAQHDPNRSVRLRTLEFFHQSYDELPSSVRETFATVAEMDSCKNVREWAKWYLKYGFRS